MSHSIDRFRYGIYVLGVIGNQEHWKNPADGRLLTFQEVHEIVKAHAKRLVAERADVEDIAVIGIDFRIPLRKGES